ncbi:MAG: threonine/serine dehydratase [Actinomycetota bacterium]|nr:threonine/serine dehydratase [Actinomycetota bacterium]
MTLPIDYSDVEAASARIAPYVHRTPVFTSSTLDDELGASVFFKAENLQKVGAFKARGATNAVLQLPEGVPGVVTHSSGNHGQAVAYAAAIRDLRAWIVMPRTAPQLKVDAVRSYGAEIVLCDHADRETAATAVAERTGAVLVHPFDNPEVIAGQATATLELIDQVGTLDAIVAPIGGGGLLSGAATVASAQRSPIRVIGAEPFAVDDAFRSLRSGHRLAGVVDPVTLADGLLTGIGARPFAILTALGADVIRVTETSILEAALYFLQRMKLVVEPSGATSLAALRTEPEQFSGSRVGVIISGGNTDLSWLEAARRL